MLELESEPLEEYLRQDVPREENGKQSDIAKTIARFLLNFKGIDYKTEWVSVLR